jgi:hypothetical protein
MKTLDAIVRLEWLTVTVAAFLLYAQSGGSWWLFAALILAPDLSMLFYLAGPRVGALAYNALHVLIPPVLLGLAGILMAKPLAVEIALIWIAHIAIDRALGYGLKLPTGFQDTHLGRIGREKKLSP